MQSNSRIGVKVITRVILQFRLYKSLKTAES